MGVSTEDKIVWSSYFLIGNPTSTIGKALVIEEIPINNVGKLITDKKV